ncbi:Zinc finger CCCH domain-containing protein 3, partial [Stegodyphus mimosarum]
MSDFRSFDDPQTKALERKLEYYTKLMEKYSNIKESDNDVPNNTDSFSKLSQARKHIYHSSHFRKPAQNMYKVIRNQSINGNVKARHSYYSSKNTASCFPCASRTVQNPSRSNKFISENRNKVLNSQFQNSSRSSVSSELRKCISPSMIKLKSEKGIAMPLDTNTRNRTVIYNSNLNCKSTVNVVKENKRTVITKELSVNSHKSIKTTSKELVNEIKALTEQLKKKSENLNKYSISSNKLHCDVLNKFSTKDNIPKDKLVNSNWLSIEEPSKENSIQNNHKILSKVAESSSKPSNVGAKSSESEYQINAVPTIFPSFKNVVTMPEKKCLNKSCENFSANNCNEIISASCLDTSQAENILLNLNEDLDKDLNSNINIKSNLNSLKTGIESTTPKSSVIGRRKLCNSNKKKLISKKKLHSSKYKLINEKLPLNDSYIKLSSDAQFRKEIKFATPVSSPTARKLSCNSKKKTVKRKPLASKYKIINERVVSLNNDHFYKNSCDDKVCISVPDNLSNVQEKPFTSQSKKLLNSKYKVVNSMHKNSSFSNPGVKKLKSVKLVKRKNSVYKLVNMKMPADIVRQKHFSPFRLTPASRKCSVKITKSLNSLHKINNSLKKSPPQVKNKTQRTKKETVNTFSKNSCTLNSQYKFINKAFVESDILKRSEIYDQSKLMNLHRKNYYSTNKDSAEANGNFYPRSHQQNLLLKRIYKSRSTIINKNKSPISQTARMIKTKYFMLNRRFSSHRYSAYPKEFQRNRLLKGHTQYNKHRYLHKEKKFSKKYFDGSSLKYARSRCNMNVFKNKKRFLFNSQNPVLIIRGQKFAIGASGKTLKRLSSKKPVLVIRGQRFAIGSSGKTLKRLSPKSCVQPPEVPKRIFIGGKTFIRTTSDTMKASLPISKTLASRVLNRSINRALTASVKKKMIKINTYCMFYNRFGRCNKGIKCPYIHDPSKIAVCTRFLRGTCKIDGCPFSHEICPGKMAICSFYLLGTCNKINCPYRHENLTPDAELCKAFVQGYCSEGKQCEKAHILVCPQYVQGICEKGDACAFPHPPPKIKKNNLKDNTNKKENEKEPEELLLRYFLPCTSRNISVNESCANVVMPRMQSFPKQPSFIPLSSTPVATYSANLIELPSFTSDEEES